MNRKNLLLYSGSAYFYIVESKFLFKNIYFNDSKSRIMVIVVVFLFFFFFFAKNEIGYPKISPLFTAT